MATLTLFAFVVLKCFIWNVVFVIVSRSDGLSGLFSLFLPFVEFGGVCCRVVHSLQDYGTYGALIRPYCVVIFIVLRG